MWRPCEDLINLHKASQNDLQNWWGRELVESIPWSTSQHLNWGTVLRADHPIQVPLQGFWTWHQPARKRVHKPRVCTVIHRYPSKLSKWDRFQDGLTLQITVQVTFCNRFGLSQLPGCPEHSQGSNLATLWPHVWKCCGHSFLFGTGDVGSTKT